MTTVEEIKRLLQRNKRRLYKELHQSKEAMFLIRKSTHSTLTSEEKEKIKEQLLEKFRICALGFLIFHNPE